MVLDEAGFASSLASARSDRLRIVAGGSSFDADNRREHEASLWSPIV